MTFLVFLFIDQESEGQKDKVTCPRPWSWYVTELWFQLRTIFAFCKRELEMKYGRKLAREKGKTEQESEEERGKSLQSQDIRTIFVFYCHITNYYRLCCLKYHTFIFIFFSSIHLLSLSSHRSEVQAQFCWVLCFKVPTNALLRVLAGCNPEVGRGYGLSLWASTGSWNQENSKQTSVLK